MYVCICHGITDRQIRDTLDRGAASLGEVQLQMPVGACCGRCLPSAHEVIAGHLNNHSNKQATRSNGSVA